jgi:hypothetical protein
LGSGDEYTFGSRRLVPTATLGRRYTDKFCLGKCGRLSEFVDNYILDVVDADKDILRLEIGMNYTTCPVHIIEAEENLLSDLTNKPNWDTLGLMSLDEAQKVLPEDFEDHANMVAIGPLMSEMIEK